MNVDLPNFRCDVLIKMGSCRIDTERRQLVRDGRERHLSPKAFDLLIALVNQRPSVIAKDQLMERVWPGVFVADANLTVLIAEIRAAIGDSAREPRFIRTHFAIGYSFIGEVTEVARSAAAAPTGLTAALRVGSRRILLGFGESSIGRDASCDVVINDASISRRHATITVSTREAIVRDLESKNGTRVGGVRITHAKSIASGDVVTFGSIDAEFAIEPPANASTQTVDVCT